MRAGPLRTFRQYGGMLQPTIPASKTMRAGGRATEAGMAFQAEVGTWFAVHILARMPIGGRFGMNDEAVPTHIRLETGMALDDIEVTLSDGGVIHVQSKTSATLATGSDAPLAKTGRQLVEWIAGAKAAGGTPDPNRSAGVLAVRTEAPRSLDDLENGCRAFDLGGSWAETPAQRSLAERRALSAFETIVAEAWSATLGSSPGDADLVDLARSFRIARFSMNEGGGDWREASGILGRRLFAAEAAGVAPLRDLRAVMRAQIASGAPADRAGLLRALRLRGHRDVGAPRFEEDVARLSAATSAELARLAVHGRLPLEGGVTIRRRSDAPLVEAMRAGSLLVIGEPGAGKTGALVHAARVLASEGAFVVFLSVDRFPGVALARHLASELGLRHGLADTLAAVPGPGCKILIIDALDAARGGLAEEVFASLLEDVRAGLVDEWTVVASIRTFDLRNGRRFREAFAGTPPDPDHVDASVANVRHFAIPRLAEADLIEAGTKAPGLGALLGSAPPPLGELMRNVFNLALASQLLADGADPNAFGGIATQAGLIDVYEDLRLPTTSLRQAAAASVAAMVRRGRLMVRRVAIRHADVDAVVRSGVLAETGDLVGFAHHVLFDHVAGRFHLEWDDPDGLIAQLAGDASVALLLAPALRFAVERLWRSDGPGRPLAWRLVANIFSTSTVDAVLANVALRIVVENVATEADTDGVASRIAADPDDPSLGAMLGRLARFAAMDMEAAGGVDAERAIAWAGLAEMLVASRRVPLADPARVLLQALFDHAALEEPRLLAAFGRAARALLRLAWAQSPPLSATSVSAIRFVGRSFASDAAASRILLDRILREPHFSRYADREAPWLAEQILPIARADPVFAAEIYACLYGRGITDDAPSHFGGQRSRIMPLSSNRRQDYDHCRWRLGTRLRDFLAISPEHGSRAVIDAVIGRADTRVDRGGGQRSVRIGTGAVELRGRVIEPGAWDEEEDRANRDDDPLRNYVRFLRETDVAGFSASVAAASRGYATASVWSRILGVGGARVHELGDLLWPLLSSPDLLENGDTLRDAVRFAGAAFATRPAAERERFERMLLHDARHAGESDRLRWHRIAGRFLALVPAEELVLPATRDLRRRLDVDGMLEGDDPSRHQSFVWEGHADHERERLRSEGVDMDEGPNRVVLDGSDALYERVQAIPEDSGANLLASLWQDAMTLLALVDANPGLHERVDRSAWGHIANAVERVASSASYVPLADGLPDLPAVLAVLDRLSASRYPEPREEGS